MTIKMWTNKAGVSFYKRSNRYYKSTGWKETEITKEEFLNHYGKEVLTRQLPPSGRVTVTP